MSILGAFTVTLGLKLNEANQVEWDLRNYNLDIKIFYLISSQRTVNSGILELHSPANIINPKETTVRSS